MPSDEFVLTLACPEQRGIVHAVSSYLLEHGCDIIDNRQFGDRKTGRFFMRVHFVTDGTATDTEPATSASLGQDFAALGDAYQMSWQLVGVDERPRVLIMVSKFGHCLNDLLYRWKMDQLKVELPVIVSNHRDLEDVATAAGIPFVHIPVTRDTKAAAEARLLEVVAEYQIDLVVLARYMQVLSDDVCKRLEGRAINIHHSFLPSFTGARPYHQAYDRGVKVIGATAHYVTPDLDEGPIIEQELIRVDHAHGPEEFVVIGRDAECLALARAVQWHVERRVLLNGSHTVVFR
ncbi:MAG TPA: formyltetrahydrofolate deformylase [Kineosporiaceae bacterium]|nr:formyltetrahydrofolate deformylase [Kineosporiaceae bacterium]